MTLNTLPAEEVEVRSTFDTQSPHVDVLWKFREWGTTSRRPTRGLLATDHVILNHGQVTWTTPELAPPLLTTTPHQWEDISALDRFNVHRRPTRRVFSGTGARTRDKASHGPIPIPLGYHGHLV
ncbi:uncharacterized protein TNCV_415891 [Trichonephila clavipes]|nr:uncharacterized protein TNCV_415891 [Trichonephila clavipes]